MDRGDRSSASSATRASTCPRPSTSGTTPASCCTCGRPRPAGSIAGGSVRPEAVTPRWPTPLTDELYSERFLVRRPLLAAVAPTPGRAAAGAAHRRDRPGRRRVRGLPARDPGRLLGHRARAGHLPGRDAAGGGDHLEPHPRRPRRPEAALPLPLGRAPRLRARGAHRDGARPGGRPSGWPARWRPPPRCSGASGCTSRRGWPRPSTGPRPWPCWGAPSWTSRRWRPRWAPCSSTARTRSAPATAGWAELVERPGPVGTVADAVEHRRPHGLVGFVRALRREGLAVPVGSSIVFAQAAAAVGAHRPPVAVLGGPGHPGHPSRGRGRLRPGVRRLLGRPGRRAWWPTPQSRSPCCSRRRAARRSRRRPRPKSPTSHRAARSSPCASAPTRCCATRTSPPIRRRAGRGPAPDGRPAA